MIRDQYTHKPISRQRKYQLRQRDKGNCIVCGQKAVNSHYCEMHAENAAKMAKAFYHKHKEDK